MTAEQKDNEQEEIEKEFDQEEEQSAEQGLSAEEVPEPESAESGTDEKESDPLLQEIESLRQQLEEHTDKVLRIQAEMENLRKRTSRDIENAHKYALEKFLKELLPVIDSMELGISASNNAEDIESLREGMDLTLKMFHDTLEKTGVSIIHPQGEKFDPEKHEAVSMQEIEGTQSGTVMTVMQKGYELNGRLVRPAMVVVAK